jgi:hypothetical protein
MRGYFPVRPPWYPLLKRESAWLRTSDEKLRPCVNSRVPGPAIFMVQLVQIDIEVDPLARAASDGPLSSQA